MPIFQKLLSFTIPACFALLVLLSFVGCSSHESKGHKRINNNVHKLSPQMTFDITLHGVLLWASTGFLMPIGVLTIRMCNREECGRKVKVIFYVHVTLQVLSVLLATAGAVLSVKNFENSFNNYHQRIGLALYGAIWVQALIGFCRPGRGSKGRSVWYFVHWILGTTVSVVGMINIYTGLEAYQKKTSRSITLWTVLFTAEVCLMAFFYLFQDKWEYMQKQGVIMGNEAVTPSDQVIPTQSENSLKEILTEPCRKKNALVNQFMN
ncbi:hypothetical protein PVL29_013226 [Vitis rotundifolia]|uniref:Cytochrome b561 domain-containing protein n=1 Tax=Vitis rotundifolia TaxID=103349 RepID=A0AA38ZL50_VITRO|nr:hypothetical protein PVL29_013226 [Vitis rotundifolia]